MNVTQNGKYIYKDESAIFIRLNVFGGVFLVIAFLFQTYDSNSSINSRT